MQIGFRLTKVLQFLLLQIVDKFLEYSSKADDNKKEIISSWF